jgi:hypothetical protein
VLPLPRGNVVLPGTPGIEIEPEGIQAVRADLLGKPLEHHPPPQPGQQDTAVLGNIRAQVGCQQRIVAAGQQVPVGMGPGHAAASVGAQHMDRGKPFARPGEYFPHPDLAGPPSGRAGVLHDGCSRRDRTRSALMIRGLCRPPTGSGRKSKNCRPSSVRLSSTAIAIPFSVMDPGTGDSSTPAGNAPAEPSLHAAGRRETARPRSAGRRGPDSWHRQKSRGDACIRARPRVRVPVAQVT